MSLSRNELGNGITSVPVIGARPLGPQQLELTTHEDGVVEVRKSIITLRDDGSAVIADVSAAEKYKGLPGDAFVFAFIKCPT